jgi:hypothetical protein
MYYKGGQLYYKDNVYEKDCLRKEDTLDCKDFQIVVKEESCIVRFGGGNFNILNNAEQDSLTSQIYRFYPSQTCSKVQDRKPWAQASQTPSATPTQVASATPTASPKKLLGRGVAALTPTKIAWSFASASDGDDAYLIVLLDSNDYEGQEIEVSIEEKDLFSSTQVDTLTGTIENGKAILTWQAKWMKDGFLQGDPEYVARIGKVSSGPLGVPKPSRGKPSPSAKASATPKATATPKPSPSPECIKGPVLNFVLVDSKLEFTCSEDTALTGAAVGTTDGSPLCWARLYWDPPRDEDGNIMKVDKYIIYMRTQQEKDAGIPPHQWMQDGQILTTDSDEAFVVIKYKPAPQGSSEENPPPSDCIFYASIAAVSEGCESEMSPESDPFRETFGPDDEAEIPRGPPWIPLKTGYNVPVTSTPSSNEMIIIEFTAKNVGSYYIWHSEVMCDMESQNWKLIYFKEFKNGPFPQQVEYSYKVQGDTTGFFVARFMPYTGSRGM